MSVVGMLLPLCVLWYRVGAVVGEAHGWQRA